MIKNIVFTVVLLSIWSNTAFSQCEKYIFSLDSFSPFRKDYSFDELCTAKTDLEWEVVDSLRKVRFTDDYHYFREMVQYETHFSNVLANSARRQFAGVVLKDGKTGKKSHATILCLTFYYQYQCDSLISTFNKYKITEYGTPSEYGGELMVLKSGYTILIFFGDIDNEDKELEKIYLVCKKALEED